MNLYELSSNFKKLSESDKYNENPELLGDTLDSIEESMTVKADNIANWIESNQKDIDWLTKKIQELRETQQVLKNKNKYLTQYLTDAIDAGGFKELKTDNHILKNRNYKASVFIEDEKQVPTDYVKTETVTKIDKKALYSDLKSGKEINGVSLKPNRKVVIK
jgi:hypothetical protein